MQQFDAAQIAAALVAGLPTDYKVKIGQFPGGDYDTVTVTVTGDNGEIDICGMRHTEMTRAEWTKADVEYVFCCYDSKNGMVNARPADHALYAKVATILSTLGLRANSMGWRAYF